MSEEEKKKKRARVRKRMKNACAFLDLEKFLRGVMDAIQTRE